MSLYYGGVNSLGFETVTLVLSCSTATQRVTSTWVARPRDCRALDALEAGLRAVSS